MLENEHNKPYFSRCDIELGTPLYRQPIEESIKTKLDGIVLRSKDCPFCGKEYENKIPPECDKCHKIIFPELVGVDNGQKWYNYIYKLNEDYQPLLQEFIQDLASHILKINLVS